MPGPALATILCRRARGLWHTVDIAINGYHCPKEVHSLWLYVEDEEEEVRRARERIGRVRRRWIGRVVGGVGTKKAKAPATRMRAPVRKQSSGAQSGLM